MYKIGWLGDGLHVHPGDDMSKFDDSDCQGKINDYYGLVSMRGRGERTALRGFQSRVVPVRHTRIGYQ